MQIAILLVYVIMFPMSKLMIMIVAGSSVFVILLETIQMKNRKGYFSDFWNLIDLFGSAGLILHAADKLGHKD
jgi:hypothetical protein